MKMPGSKGEHRLQKELATTRKALAFYNNQMLDHLNPTMSEFLSNQEIVFISTADAKGECDCSFRTGPPGWVRVINEKTIAYPEYRGNGRIRQYGEYDRKPAHWHDFYRFF